jgi:hypothetical protein
METICTICDRVLWGNVIYLGNGHYRHDECAPGSPAWCTYYTNLPVQQRTDAGDILYRYSASRGLL